MKFFKTRTAAILVAGLLAALAVFIGLRSAIPRQNSSNPFVYDGAGVLSAKTESEIYTQNAAGGNGNFYVITTDKTGRFDLYDYALKITEEWNLNSYSAIVLVMQPDKEDYQLIYGSDYSYALDGDGFGAFLGEYIEPSFAKGDYDKAALGFTQGAKSVAAGKDSYVFPGYGEYYAYTEYYSSSDNSVFIYAVIAVLLFVGVWVISIMFSGGGGFSARRTYVFWGPTVRHYHPPRRYAPPSGRPGGGFSGGGRSMGGFSGGGRSGGFRGGGRR